MALQPDLAVIIPTLNEEHYVGNLLDSIAAQTMLPKEVVVVDAYSTDKTKQEVLKRQKKLKSLKFYQLEKYTVARQRNYGALQTKSPHILFLDADMELKDNETLEKYILEISKKKPDAAAATNLPNSTFWKDKLYFWLMDVVFKAIKPVYPVAQGMNIYVSRKMFKKIGGFDEDVRIGEDHELIQRITKKFKGKFIFLEQPKVYTSTRRIQSGRKKFVILMIISFLLVLFLGYRRNPIKYEFGKFKK